MSKSVVRKKIFSKGSHPSSGGGGGGDMFKATYDPANLSKQVITTAIDIGILDFVDLVNKTDLNGNNPGLDGLLLGQTYAVSGMDNFGYSTDCRYYVTAVANENGDTKPNEFGTMVAPSSSTAQFKTAEVSFSWASGNESPMTTRIGRNMFYGVTSGTSFDKWLIDGTTLCNIDYCRFYAVWGVEDLTANNLSNLELASSEFFGNIKIMVNENQLSRISRSSLFNSIVSFGSSVVDVYQEIVDSNIENSNIYFDVNTGATLNQTISGCEIRNVDIILESEAQLINCRIIGDSSNSPITITVPAGVKYTGKTFIYGVYSDFDTTIDISTLAAPPTLNQLTLPSPYNDYVGIYYLTNATNPVIIETITSIPAHPFRIVGDPVLGCDFKFQTVGTPPLPGYMFYSIVEAIVGAYATNGNHDYLVFQKYNIDGEPDALRLIEYQILA